MKNLIEKISGKPVKHKKESKRIKFDSDDNLPLNKLLKLHNLTIIVGSVFKKTSIIHKFVYMNAFMSYKESSNTKELMYQKELTLINHINQKNA